jgi:hypothetical protein
MVSIPCKHGNPMGYCPGGCGAPKDKRSTDERLRDLEKRVRKLERGATDTPQKGEPK